MSATPPEALGETVSSAAESAAPQPSAPGPTPGLTPGLTIDRRWSMPGRHPYEEVVWEGRRSVITDEKGRVIFEAPRVEVPSEWSQLATDIVASKYLRKAGVPGTGSETSVKQLIARVARTIREAGDALGGYFATGDDADAFEAELTALLLTQRAAFNSPVWFNCGLYHRYGILGSGGNWYWDPARSRVVESDNAYQHPQSSACFIQSIHDDLMSIYDLVKHEARIFKYGSGSGTNFSRLRGKQEKLSGGGTSSGLMSFLEVFDRAAGSTKSGGTTRRAAKMVCLDADHPEIVDFIEWKMREEKKAKALIASGYESDFNGEAYRTVSGQNSNNSVRVTDEFMRAVQNGGGWQTRLRTTGQAWETLPAAELYRKLCDAAWHCADPGLQYDTTINDWHTCANTDRIYASNPCSEYMFLDDSACNLSSINLVKFVDDAGRFDIEGFRHACRIMILAQEILVDFSSYPTERIAQNSHDYRPLGLGYANLGTLLMVQGLPYDSPAGFATAGAITAVMCGTAYRTSAEIARSKGSFAGYASNRDPMLRVMNKHRAAAYAIDPAVCPPDLLAAAREDWDAAVAWGEQHGYRNAQATVIAPTGTIGLLMDCDTTGIEPDFALVKFKKLAGGGYFKIVNQSVHRALRALGYDDAQIERMIAYACGTGRLAGAPWITADALSAKGVTADDLARIEAQLPTVFDLDHAFTVATLGDASLAACGVTRAQLATPGFSFLKVVGFSADQIREAGDVICGRMTLEGAPELKPEHLPVFDCANKCGRYGTRFIAPMGHLRMMAAVQPFISGAISKTVNLPAEATVEEIERIYTEGWRMGLKAVALYRDGSKSSQPLTASNGAGANQAEPVRQVEYRPLRRRLPDERRAITHKFSIDGHEGYLTVGLYEDGSPGEIFIVMSKEGSTISGLMDAFATAVSISLQYGVPLADLVFKFAHMRFEPSGFTKHPQIRIAKSIIDYLFRWLALKFMPTDQLRDIGVLPEGMSNAGGAVNGYGQAAVAPVAPAVPPIAGGSDAAEPASMRAISRDLFGDAPPCDTCGGLMVRNGTCYKCLNCGGTSGCS
ncbi:MAG TPA: vitamin B12-dependent ribonucleotide reductase [Nitrospiria bacterium]|nr:vitamin B12-dependent ribonucleotide reductase [Nitrospiria bacterium]